jgi:phosphoribosyl 1,2-cyclic phosphodiesterase
MLMRLTILASGSSGNCAILSDGRAKIMLDCGVPMSQLKKLLRKAGLNESGFCAILLTHGHGDHCKFAVQAAKKYHCTIYSTLETRQALRKGSIPWCEIEPGQSPPLWDLHTHVIPVPHIPGSVGFVFEQAGRKLVFFVDCGHVTQEMVTASKDAHVVCIEANYDSDMISLPGLPPEKEYARQRSQGPNGHMSNNLFYRYLAAIDAHPHTVVAIHVSHDNNSQSLVEQFGREAMSKTNPLAKLLVADEENLPISIEV